MPKYQITAPDGRIVVVEGTKPPTEQDAAAIFAQIGSQKTQEPEQSPYSAMDKVKHTLRAAGEAAPFGMGDLVAGYVGAQARNLADYTHGKDLKTRVKGLGKLAFGIVSPKDFKKERADFIKEQEDFAKHHGGLNFAGEMAGGLLTGGAGAARNVIGKQGIKALMNAGAREGAKFGAAYGAGSALTQDTDKLSVPNALIGAGTGLAGGAVMGAALPPAIAVGAKALSPVVKGGQAVAKKIATILKNDAQQANQALGNAGYVATDLAPENKVFLNLLEANPEGTMEAVKAGEPLVAHANRKQLRRTRGAVTADEGADQTFIEAKRAFDQGKIQKGEDISDRLLSKESGYTATERIADEAHNKYQPLYEEVMKAGEIDLPQEIISNETILGAIQEAQGRAGYTKLKANNVRVLDKAKRVLQDKFKSLQRAGKNDEAREYQLAKEELVAFLDSKLPKYKEARKAFMEGQELQEFVDLGRKIKNISHAEVERIAKTLTPEQQQALKAGIGDSVRESLYNTRSEGTNVLEKAFPAPLRRKMQALGIKDEEISNEIAKEIQTNANYQLIGGGSNTMNKAYDAESVGKLGYVARTIKAIKSPLTTLEKAADKLDNKIAGLDSEEIARLMFDPKALAEEAKKPQHQRKIAEILRKSQQDKSGESIAGYLGGKLKEKGGYAMKDLADNTTTEKLLKPRDFVSENFVSEVDNFLKDNSISNYQKIDMGQIPWIYMANGLEEQPLRTNKLSIRKAMGLLTPAELKANPKWHNHNVPKDVIDKMPELIADPLAIFKSNTEKGKYIAVLDAQVKGDPVLAVISPGKDGGYTFMPTAYEKGSFANFVKNTQEANNVVYVDGKRSLLPHTHLQAVSVGNKDPKHSIATKEGLVKRYFENRKKLFKNSKAVDEEGKLIELSHGTRGDFNTFDRSKAGQSNPEASIGFWFSPSEKVSENFVDGIWYGEGKPKVMKTYLNLKNPKIYERGKIDKNALEKINKEMLFLEEENKNLYKKLDMSDLRRVSSWKDLPDDDFFEASKFMDKEVALNARKFLRNEDKLDKLGFQKEIIENNDSYHQYQNDLDMFSEFWFHKAGAGDYIRGSHLIGAGRKNSIEAANKLREKLIKEGYDGIIIKDTVFDASKENPVSQFVAFYPEQIKSVYNRGTFSKKSKNIYKSIVGGLGISQILKSKENK